MQMSVGTIVGAIGQIIIPRLIIDLVEMYAGAKEHHLGKLVFS